MAGGAFDHSLLRTPDPHRPTVRSPAQGCHLAASAVFSGMWLLSDDGR